MRNTLNGFVLAGVLLVLAGCGGTKLVGGRTLPDETRVVDGPTLAVPPDFELRPPQKTEDYEAVLRAQKSAEAKSLILGGVSGTAPVATGGEDAWLVEKAGTVDGSIREKLDQDAAEAAKEPPSWWDRMRGKGKE